MKSIELTMGKVALVSDEDYEWLSQWKWSAPKIQGRHVCYAIRRVRMTDGRYKLIFMHREILRVPNGTQVDHRDGDGLNNTRENLRVASHAENTRNARRRSDNRSGFKGVRLNSGRWQARIRIDGKQTHLGLFGTAQEAARAYDIAAREVQKEFARPNFQMEPQE